VAEDGGGLMLVAPLRLCMDNTGIERLRLGLMSGLDAEPRPRWEFGGVGWS